MRDAFPQGTHDHKSLWTTDKEIHWQPAAAAPKRVLSHPLAPRYRWVSAGTLVARMGQHVAESPCPRNWGWASARWDSTVRRLCIQCTYSRALSRKVGKDKVSSPEGPCSLPGRQPGLCLPQETWIPAHAGMKPSWQRTSRNKEIEENCYQLKNLGLWIIPEGKEIPFFSYTLFSPREL